MQNTQGFSNSRALSALSIDGSKILYQLLGFSNNMYKLSFKHCCQQKVVRSIEPFSKSMDVFAPTNLYPNDNDPEICVLVLTHILSEAFL